MNETALHATSSNPFCACYLRTDRKVRWSATVVGSKSQPYLCLYCGKRFESEEAKEEPGDKVFYETFDKVETKVSLNTLKVESEAAEWKNRGAKPKEYYLASIEMEEVMLADLTKIANEELTKTLFEDLSIMSKTFSSKYLYIAISKGNPQFTRILRNLFVYGFEKVSSEEKAKFTANHDVVMFKLDLLLDEDYVESD
eukprot:TRINITY_DN1023_c0_g2_i15.p1 TRINITY_DN1023_c0_g2~~TRINITY_DN1023_c0_g2_i15.p1  ORF type:complete len:198 (-),score=62.54 TRINITY_DN1023_c0_g2_i15:176-769(-)